MRAFIAVTLAPDVVTTLGACRAALLDAEPAWRREKWVADASLHITLRFLGDVSVSALDRISERLPAAVCGLAPFTLAFTSIAAIPNPRAATLIWAEAPDTTHAAELAARVGEATDGLAEPTRERPFRAHVTMCRARRPRRIDPTVLAIAAAPLTSPDAYQRCVSVASVTLFTSTLTSAGPVYQEVAVAALDG